MKIKLKDLLVRESIDIAKKYAKGDEELIASNESYWQWEYDHDINHALLFMKANGDLRLSVSNEHIKSGLGKGEFYKELESESVGSVRKPDIARIKNLVKKHGHDRTRAGGPFKSQWFDVLNSKTDLLTNIIKQYNLQEAASFKKQPKFVAEFSTKGANESKLKNFLAFLDKQGLNYYYNKQHQTLELDEKDTENKYFDEMIDDIGLKEL